MRQFNTPPQWPQLPRPDWRPPRRWRPPTSWPAAPARWAFWVDEHGRPVRGPIGRYGGPRYVTVLAMAVVPITLITLVLLNPFARNETTSNEPLLRPSATAPTVATTATAQTAQTAQTMPVTRAPTRRTTGPVTVLVGTPTPAPSSTTDSASATPPSSATPAPVSTTTSSTPSATTAIGSPTTASTPTAVPTSGATTVFKNCAEARAAGRAPLHRGDPGYSRALDHNGDGVACDRGNS